MLNTKQIQTNLWYLGFYNSKIDSKYGILTKKAVKSFQKSYELTRDGIWGHNSNAKCLQVVKEIQKKIGAMQDGIVGTETIEKTKAYQKLVGGLVVDGRAGVETRAKLFQTANLSWIDFPHFQRKEFACRCGCGFDNINLKVVKMLEEIRAHFGGKPVIITSRL